MLRVVLLVCVAFTTVFAQSCIPGAALDSNGKCVCSAGLSGQGDLCCHSPVNYKSCYVAGDPVVTSYTGRKIGMDFPCGTIVSSTKSGANCQVDVYASSKEMRSGVFYTSKVLVKLISGGDNALIEFDFDDSPAEYLVSENGATVKQGPFGTTENVHDLLGSQVTVSYDAANQLITTKACDTIINVRPAKGDDPNAGKTPGLCVMANPAASYPSSEQVCGLTQDVSGKSAYLTQAIKPAKNYIFPTTTLSSATYSDYAGRCNNYRTIMGTKCVYADRENALKKCAFILFHPLIRKCFYESGTGPSEGRVWDSYTKCLDVYCTGNKDMCDNFKVNRQINICGRSLLNCETWEPYRRVNRFVAGEGENVNFGGDNGNGEEETTWNPSILGGNDNDAGTGGGEGGFNPDDFGI